MGLSVTWMHPSWLMRAGLGCIQLWSAQAVSLHRAWYAVAAAASTPLEARRCCKLAHAARRWRGEPTVTSFVESAVDEIIS